MNKRGPTLIPLVIRNRLFRMRIKLGSVWHLYGVNLQEVEVLLLKPYWSEVGVLVTVNDELNICVCLAKALIGHSWLVAYSGCIRTATSHC